MRNDSSKSRPPNTTGQLRQHLLLLVASLLLVLSSRLDASGPLRLYVFANADMRAGALEKQLEASLPGVDVTVFSRIRGFEAALEENPDGVLARKPVLDSLRLRAELQGYSQGKATEKFVLLSTDVPASPDRLGGKTVGAVNIMGRREMEDFVRDLLGGTSTKIKNVTHERDLLALLQFRAAEAVITSESWADRLRQKSEMNLKTTILSKEVGLVAVAFGSPSGKGPLANKIKSAGSSFDSALGVTQWR